MTKIICIDPGHGGSDPGACGNGLRECDIALLVCLKAKGYLEQAGCQVVMTRETDIDVAYPDASATEELQARCDISNNANAVVFISVHCNAFSDEAAHGTETLHFAPSEWGRKLAGCIQNRLLGVDPKLFDRGLKTNPLYVTRHADAVACLTELAFISNPTEAGLLADEATQEGFARAIACGVTDYLSQA